MIRARAGEPVVETFKPFSEGVYAARIRGEKISKVQAFLESFNGRLLDEEGGPDVRTVIASGLWEAASEFATEGEVVFASKDGALLVKSSHGRLTSEQYDQVYDTIQALNTDGALVMDTKPIEAGDLSN